jgi:exodeoxyribonuclease VII small subunit
VSEGPTFEEARAELERIVAQLESGEAGLEDAISLWERGEELYRLCVAKLDAAEGRIEELARAAGGGSGPEDAGAVPAAESKGER